MKTRTSGKNNLINEGKANWEGTEEFNKKVNEIKRELSEKYSLILLAEKNWLRRLQIRFRQWHETNKKIDELSSWKNLHLGRAVI
jgi:hypothetical protein